MDCQTVAEQLPWYLNETLDSRERQAVAAHLEACAACRQELEETSFARQVFSSHVPVAVLHEFALSGEVSGWDRALIEDHLGSCPDCDSELALIQKSYQSLDTAPPPRASPMPSRALKGLLAAAALTIVFLGMGWRSTWSELQTQRAGEPVSGQETRSLTQPLADYRTLDLFPGELSLRSQGPVSVVLEPGTRGIALTLHSRLEARPGPYRLEISDRGGQELWRSNPVRQPDGTFTLILPETFLAEGGLDFRLYPPDGSGPFESYDLTIQSGK